MQTRVSLAATRSTCASNLRIFSPVNTRADAPSCCRSCRFSCFSRSIFKAFCTVSRSLSVERGFSRKSSAPRRVAFTAISMCACPDIITTGAVTPAALICSSSVSPSICGITTSEKIRSNFSFLTISSAFTGLSQTVASCPASRKARESEAKVLASSSIMRRLAFI